MKYVAIRNYLPIYLELTQIDAHALANIAKLINGAELSNDFLKRTHVFNFGGQMQINSATFHCLCQFSQIAGFCYMCFDQALAHAICSL